ncbi:chorismate synthase [Fructobacillus pseudoficulneus]|uniref:Chorismate synthase n=1 Tax=Fructobacillus pseudoficulneus TaxID=220714 RepID=A0A3F3GUC0_9LACO|nr:chorismate synthase [Fructobacillus pseudoficulneus]
MAEKRAFKKLACKGVKVDIENLFKTGVNDITTTELKLSQIPLLTVAVLTDFSVLIILYPNNLTSQKYSNIFILTKKHFLRKTNYFS